MFLSQKGYVTLSERGWGIEIALATQELNFRPSAAPALKPRYRAVLPFRPFLGGALSDVRFRAPAREVTPTSDSRVRLAGSAKHALPSSASRI